LELDAIRVKAVARLLRNELAAFRWQTYVLFASFLSGDTITACGNPITVIGRQIGSFVGVGVVATTVHYAVLVSLVQVFRVAPVPAALCSFVAGGVLSYGLNRRHTFGSERPHEQAVWRFSLVAGVAFVLTYLFMRLLIETWEVPYLPAQGVTTCIVMMWTFTANKLWTFRGEA
jgi:putative flippase GtrA